MEVMKLYDIYRHAIDRRWGVGYKPVEFINNLIVAVDRLLVGKPDLGPSEEDRKAWEGVLETPPSPRLGPRVGVSAGTNDHSKPIGPEAAAQLVVRERYGISVVRFRSTEGGCYLAETWGARGTWEICAYRLQSGGYGVVIKRPHPTLRSNITGLHWYLFTLCETLPDGTVSHAHDFDRSD
jgi:hypothetical protein